MSGRGAGSRRRTRLDESERFSFVPAPVLAKPVITVAQELLQLGLTSADVCSLFTHAAAVLCHQQDGMPREEFLALCAELYDADAVERGVAVTAPGGSA
jgi:hypothetical protein